MQTIKLSAMGKKWLDALVNSRRIHDFCMAKYNKPPTFFFGVNVKKEPSLIHCPAVFILLGVKSEGLETNQYRYAITVSWSILQPDILVDGVRKKWCDTAAGNVIDFIGLTESDEFGQLLYEELAEANPNYPIAKLDYNIESTEHFPQWPGFMILTTEIETAIGGELEY